MDDSMSGKRRYFKGPMPVGDMNGKRRASRNSRLQQKVEDLEKQYQASLGSSMVSGKLDDNMNVLKKTFNNCSDFIPRELLLGGNGPKCLVAFVDNLVNVENLNNFLLKPRRLKG